MKKLTFLCLILSGCTADTNVECPCRVIGNDGQIITAVGIHKTNWNNGKFTFYSQHNYQIGDTIK